MTTPILPFATEQFFARYEFTTPYLLCASDCESMTVGELLALADIPASALGRLHLGYTESQGHPALRREIAATYETIGAADIVVLGAPEEGIYLTMRALLQPGDEVIALTPAYDSLRHLAAHIVQPAPLKPWPIRPTPTSWRLDLDDLARLLTPQTRLLIVNFPHNPTGLLPDAAQFHALVEMARERGIWLFCDEMYRGLENAGTPMLPSAADLYEQAIVLAGLSKVHGLPGLRSGWLVVRNAALREQLINWKHYTTICPPAPSEFLATAALRARAPLIARNRAIIAQNLALARTFFARWTDLFTWRPPQAGSVALVEMAVPSTTAYCERLAREQGILLLPGPFLGADDRFVRFGLGRHNFGANLAQYDAYLAQAQ